MSRRVVAGMAFWRRPPSGHPLLRPPRRPGGVGAGGWKLIVTPALSRTELYDLGHDGGEHNDRSGAGPEGERLAALLAHWETTAPVASRPDGYDPALRTKLHALGYAQ